MTAPMKQCRVCGEPIEFHRKPLKECIIKAYGLPENWKDDYPSLFSLCNTQGLVTAWGQPSKGMTSIKFKHFPEAVVTSEPAKAIMITILTSLAPTELTKDERSEMKAEAKAKAKEEEAEEEHTIVDEDGEQVG